MGKIEVVISDFGGVLTTPLSDAFLAIEEETTVSAADYGSAMAVIAEQSGKHPLFELECGRLTEDQFLDQLELTLTVQLGREISVRQFRKAYFEALEPNYQTIDLMHELKADGLRMALLTNNVREWRPVWETMAPVNEIFEVIVDSSFVNMRKPEPEIYHHVLEELAHGQPESCLFVDDMEVNCRTAAELGMQTVQFGDTEQSLAAIRAAVNGNPHP